MLKLRSFVLAVVRAGDKDESQRNSQCSDETCESSRYALRNVSARRALVIIDETHGVKEASAN
jgi:hypothetical protein